MSTAIKVQNLSKAYQLGQIGTGTLSRDLERWWALKRGKDDPFLKIGETNDRTRKGTSDVVWSLRNLHLEIQQGEALGVIGRNGAGKSTLLKVLSRVTAPTTGSIKVKGRVASLLEVGTGFHPELTGRENIFLNGAILGMRKREILKKFDEIVAFAGVERYVDTPVKRYSSGMYVRLAFAVAAHLESEILIVDEVLAVGDAEFQKKCLGKMGEISKGEGRTVLFVSHNMASVRNLCNTGVLLANGKCSFMGAIEETVLLYQQVNEIEYKTYFENKSTSNNTTYIKTFKINSDVTTGKPFEFEVCISSSSFHSVQFAVGFRLPDSTPLLQLFSGHVCKGFDLKKGDNYIVGRIDQLPLSSGVYELNLWVGSGQVVLDSHGKALTLIVKEGVLRSGGPVATKNGYPVILDTNWKY